MNDLALLQPLLRHLTPDKDILYVICPLNIGDFLINGELCHALLKRKRKKACVIIERDRFISSGLNFVGVMEVQYIPQVIMDLVRQYIYATHEYEADNYVYGHFHVGQDGYLLFNYDLSFVDRYKENVFRLPLDTELIPPIISPLTDSQKAFLNETYVLDSERTIILAPYANTYANLEESLWIKLVAELNKKNKDYVFYTNVAAPNEKPVPGTAPMFTTFPELIYLAKKVKCFIGFMSGIFDLLALTDARLLYIIKSIGLWHFDLEINFKHTNSKAFFYIKDASEQENILDLMKQNNITSIDDVALFGGIVMGNDISFDMNSLIEKIISAIDKEKTS